MLSCLFAGAFAVVVSEELDMISFMNSACFLSNSNFYNNEWKNEGMANLRNNFERMYGIFRCTCPINLYVEFR